MAAYLGMQMRACENNTPLHQAVHTQLWGQGGVSAILGSSKALSCVTELQCVSCSVVSDSL